MGQQKQMAEAEKTGADLALLGAGASVLLAWYQFFVRGNRTRGLFIGLWPPTILAFSSYLRQKAMSDKMESVMPSSSNAVSRLLG
ncbi:hypothetical protein [Halegenticoccus tardaugens]|uniref:hypothetical protein n=1 Tax=Halegenticoccus tardaugens TaxID=2071624 RepID=UPI0037443553